MAFPGELLGIYGIVCQGCNKSLPLEVCSSAAGYYLGYSCCLGPISRETEYFRTAEEAEVALVGPINKMRLR